MNGIPCDTPTDNNGANDTQSMVFPVAALGTLQVGDPIVTTIFDGIYKGKVKTLGPDYLTIDVESSARHDGGYDDTSLLCVEWKSIKTLGLLNDTGNVSAHVPITPSKMFGSGLIGSREERWIYEDPIILRYVGVSTAIKHILKGGEANLSIAGTPDDARRLAHFRKLSAECRHTKLSPDAWFCKPTPALTAGDRPAELRVYDDEDEFSSCGEF